MATVYKIELTSYWINYNEKRLEKIIKEALEKASISNQIEVKAERT
jgi:hypothetical protein|tara:strand:+ start:309 stop:446 length:138 start_codon:yes stop_codon:yes gene_type:complete